jgi:sulfate permease, SulP family
MLLDRNTDAPLFFSLSSASNNVDKHTHTHTHVKIKTVCSRTCWQQASLWQQRKRMDPRKDTQQLPSEDRTNEFPQHQGITSHDDGQKDAVSCAPVVQFLRWDSWIDDGNLQSVKTDLFAGVTLALTQIAPSVAYAILGGAQPNDGLRVSAILTIGCSIFGGRPGMLSAAAGAVAPMLPEYVNEHGPEGLSAIAVACGVIILVASLLGVARFVRIIPTTVMLGFLDGLGIILAKSQISRFKVDGGVYVTGVAAWWMAFICIVSFLTMMVLPRFTQVVPSAFAAIVVGTAIEHILRATGNGTITVQDLYTLSGSFAAPRHPRIDYSNTDQISAVLTSSAAVSVSACVESFLCVHLLNRATKTKGNFRREGITLGVFNIVNGFLDGFPGCAVIGPSLLNVDMHAATRRGSCFLCGVLVLVVYLVASPAVDLIPTSALAAVIFGIAVKTFAWETIPMILLMRIPLADSVVILITVAFSIWFDLAIGVGVGFAMASLLAMGAVAVAHGAHGWVQLPVAAITTAGGGEQSSSVSDDDERNEPPFNPLIQSSDPHNPVASSVGVVRPKIREATPLSPPNALCYSPCLTPSIIAIVDGCIRQQVRHVHIPLRGVLFFGTVMNFEDTILDDVERMLRNSREEDDHHRDGAPPGVDGSDTKSTAKALPSTDPSPAVDDDEAPTRSPPKAQHHHHHPSGECKTHRCTTPVTDIVLDAQGGAFMIRDFTAADSLREVAVEISRLGLRCHVVGLDAVSLSILREVKRLGGAYHLLRVPQLLLLATATSTTTHSRRITIAKSRNSLTTAAEVDDGGAAAGGGQLQINVEAAAERLQKMDRHHYLQLEGLEWSAEVLVHLHTAGPVDEHRHGHIVTVPVSFPWALSPHATCVVDYCAKRHVQHVRQDSIPYAALEDIDHGEECLIAFSLVACFNFHGLGEKAYNRLCRPVVECLTRCAMTVVKCVGASVVNEDDDVVVAEVVQQREQPDQQVNSRLPPSPSPLPQQQQQQQQHCLNATAGGGISFLTPSSAPSSHHAAVVGSLCWCVQFRGRCMFTKEEREHIATVVCSDYRQD